MGQDYKRERDETTVGWQPGAYERPDKGSEMKRRIIVVVIALLFICMLVSIAVGAYYLI